MYYWHNTRYSFLKENLVNASILCNSVTNLQTTPTHHFSSTSIRFRRRHFFFPHNGDWHEKVNTVMNGDRIQ